MPTVNLASGLSVMHLNGMPSHVGNIRKRLCKKLKEPSLRSLAFVDDSKRDHTKFDACDAGGATRNNFESVIDSRIRTLRSVLEVIYVVLFLSLWMNTYTC